MADDLNALKTKRGQIKAKVTRFRKFLDGNDPIQLEDRLETFKTHLAEFEAVQSAIELLDSDKDANENERQSFEDSYYDLLAKSRKILATHQSQQTSPKPIAETNVITNPQIQVKLPTINLPTFSGKYEDWRQFYELFQSVIQSNSSLSDIQKFYYLKSSLKGPALNVLESLEVSASNYDTAWTLLKNRFDNKRIIVNNHLKSILDIQKLEKESGSALRDLLDTINKHLRALQSLGQPVEHWDSLLVLIISKKLDHSSIKLWENLQVSTELPKFTDLTKFLESRCNVLESINTNVSSRFTQAPIKKQYSSHVSSESKQSHSTSSKPNTPQLKCSICQSSHRVFQCNTFLSMSVADRHQAVKNAKLCFNCLSNRHSIKDCTASGCKTCSQKHNTLLHFNKKPQPQSTSVPIANNSPTDHNPSETTSLSSISEDHILLSTAIIHVEDATGIKNQCRVLLDSASQSNFISEDMANRLRLNKIKTHKPIVGIGQSRSNVSHTVRCKIYSKHSAYTASIECLVLKQITHSLPSVPIDSSKWKLPPTIQLADINFGRPGPIDILIGAELFYNLLCIGQMRPHKQGPLYQKTSLGWVASGKVVARPASNRFTTCHLTIDDRVDTQLKRFWEQEDIEAFSTKEEDNPEPVFCETHFKQTTAREPSGQYIVKLPFKRSISELGSSEKAAETRFLQMENKLIKNPNLYKSYSDFMTEYEQLGHMEQVYSNKDDRSQQTYYIPHLPVVREDSSTTKLRVVFDASAKSTSGLSLNDILAVGPTIQQDVFSILCRFRCYKYALTADIEKMYRGIKVDPDQHDLQRILWRSDRSKPISIYKLKTVTYGTASAPFLAIRTLHQLAMDEEQHYPEAASVVLNDFYVDDLMTGAETIEQAQYLQDQLTKLLGSGSFNLRKWSSNSPSILDSIPTDKRADGCLHQAHQPKVLGIGWDAQSDCFNYFIKEDTSTKITKRTVLSDIASLYDPLGLLGPVILKAKLMLQELWKLGLKWDESLPVSMYTAWDVYKQQLTSLRNISINRFVNTTSEHRTELHGFCDASERAYGACVYVRTISDNGNIQVNLLCSKSKVAPIKKSTIPRLELCGALLLSKLINKVKSIHITHRSCTLWSDSTIVLAWVKSESSTFKTFVSNRIKEIQALTNQGCSWNHVKTTQNPADLISRGVNPDQLVNCVLWWRGPDWLTKDSAQWPTVEFANLRDGLPEQKQPLSLTAVVEHQTIDTNKHSSFLRLQRITAYCFRFMANMKNANNKRTGSLTTSELQEATEYLIKIEQKSHFREEYISLNKGKQIKPGSNIITLQPFIDSKGIIRVGGRLRNANMDINQKHPVLLPHKSHLTELIVKHEHYRSLHAGPQLLLSTLRQKYWPLRGKDLARKIVHNCIKCFKVCPKSSQPQMGDLPSARTQIVRPFTNTGTDLCGPILIKSSRRRHSQHIKGYVVLFVCLSTKAIHLEAVTDMTTQSFLAAFKRFVSRRGICSNIYSDNGTNFVGANRELQDLRRLFLSEDHKKNIIDETSALNIKWHFIPPKSPHFGGLWEAGVKSMKYHLKRCIGNASLTYEELCTTLAQIEACLNSRPLIPLSNDPNDLYPLTPGHFLIGDPLTAVPEPNLAHITLNRLSHWQRSQLITQHFWSRWSKEYLSFLQQRPKWTREEANINPGQLVIVKDDSLPPLKWVTARVIAVHPGRDGRVRVATVKTTAGTYKRATNRLCALPIEDSTQ